jgi:hypothetical protein
LTNIQIYNILYIMKEIAEQLKQINETLILIAQILRNK